MVFKHVSRQVFNGRHLVIRDCIYFAECFTPEANLGAAVIMRPQEQQLLNLGTFTLPIQIRSGQVHIEVSSCFSTFGDLRGTSQSGVKCKFADA